MRRRAGLAALLLTLVWSAMASAEFVICGTAQQFTRAFSADPTQVTDPTCTVFPKPTNQAQRDAMEAQKALIQSFMDAHTLRYLKVINGQAVEKTAGEKQAVDDAIAADVAVATEYQQELANQDLCNTASLSTITSRIQTLHDNLETTINTKHDDNATAIAAIAAANLASLKGGLNTLNDSMALGLKALNDRYSNEVTVIARCFRAFRGAR